MTPDVDAVVDELYDDIVGPWWPTERVHVDRGYRDLAFPYQEFDWPEVTLQTRWTIGDYLNYLGTWSSVRRTHHRCLHTGVSLAAGRSQRSMIT